MRFGRHVLGALLAIAVPFGFLMSVAPANAQLQNPDQILFGETQAYSVIFRGNGEAVVDARFVISNSTAQPLSTFTFTVPQVNPYDFAVLQQVLPSGADYANNYYYYGYGQGPQYQQIPYTQSGSTYTLTLPTPIAAYQSGAIIISYAAQGYVTSFLGLNTFHFNTIQVQDRIQDLTLSIGVDADEYLQGSTSGVSYNSGSGSQAVPAAAVNISSQSLNQVVSEIGQGGSITKQAQDLEPGESYTAVGEYASSWWRFYLSGIIWTIVIIVALFLGMWFLKRRKGRRNKKEVASASAPAVVASVHAEAPAQKKTGSQIAIIDIANAGWGFFSAALVVALSYGITLLTSSGILNSYSSYYGYGENPVFALVIPIMIILLYVLIIFTPPIVMGATRGWKAFLSVLICQFLWYLIFLAIYLFFFLGSPQQQQQYRVYGDPPVAVPQ